MLSIHPARSGGAAGGGKPSSECRLPEGRGGAPGGLSGRPPGKPGLIKTLKPAGLDDRGEVHAPLADEPEKNAGRIARGHGGSGSEGTSPTHAYSHDPSVYGELKEWLDGLHGSGRADDEADAQVAIELACWICRLAKGGKAGFINVSKPLRKEGYGDLWRALVEAYRSGQDQAQLDR